MDGRRQPALMIMPHELPDPGNDVVNRGKRRRPIDLRFEPLPEAFEGIVLWRIGGQVFEHHPVVLREKPLDRTAFVNRGIIQNQDQEGRGKPLMELMQKLQEALGCPACRTLPIEALGAEMQRAKQGGTLALPWRRHFDLLALATPAALDVGFIGEM